MAKKGSLDKATCKEWTKHLKKKGKRIANKSERRMSKLSLK